MESILVEKWESIVSFRASLVSCTVPTPALSVVPLALSLDPYYSKDFFHLQYKICLDFPGGSDSKASVYNVRDLGSIPGLGRFPGEGNGNPLQYSCLKNPMGGGAWCRLLSMGSQRVAHDWATSLSFLMDILHSSTDMHMCTCAHTHTDTHTHTRWGREVVKKERECCQSWIFNKIAFGKSA